MASRGDRCSFRWSLGGAMGDLLLLPAFVAVLRARFVYLLPIVMIVSQRAENLGRSEVFPFSQDVFDRHPDLVIVVNNMPNGDPRVFDDGLPATYSINFDNVRVRCSMNYPVFRAHNRLPFKSDFESTPLVWQPPLAAPPSPNAALRSLCRPQQIRQAIARNKDPGS